MKNIRGIHRHRQQGDLISLLLFIENKESRLKISVIATIEGLT
jgi:hypothetical protein